MTDVSKELLPTEAMIEAGAAKVAEMCGHDEAPRGWDKDVARNVYLAMTRAQPAPSDVERVARAIANARWLRMGDENYDCWPDHPHLHEDWKREARAALSAMGVSDEVVRLREALNAIIDRAPERDPKWAGMNARDIARQALAQSDSGDTQ
jgi:hypothetical protein